ncbi:MAG: hypothetical protein K2H41_12085 [Acetatifactor sp.]|nr:hypothetical protein [Acetatifactor sp.]
MISVWREEFIDYKRNFLRVVAVFAGGMVLFVILCSILKLDLSQWYKKLSFLPAAILDIISFWRNKLMPDSQKYCMTWLYVANIPLLFYAALLPARLLGEENENGSMAFICNAPFGRKEIFWGKFLTAVTCYGAIIVLMALCSMLMVLPPAVFKIAALKFIVGMYGMLLAVGLFLMGLTTLYCSLKNAATCSSDGVMFWCFLDMLVGWLYTGIMLMRDMIISLGREIVMPQGLLTGMNIIRNLSFVQWCCPADIYRKFPLQIFVMVLAVSLILFQVSAIIYSGKEFGEN